jgi:glycosyltransferase involved in cell wall biosynthesis
MRVCIAYDCVFPNTIGGAERWYTNLAERLAAAGHDVTYITRRQWTDSAESPRIEGVDVRAISGRSRLYGAGARRRAGPPARFGIATARHLLRHGRRYDVVHTASFPFFSVLAIAACRPWARYRVVVDWHELWDAAYWRAYAGPIVGPIGALVQQLCLRVSHSAICFADLTAERLRASGVRPVVVRGQLSGRFAGDNEIREPTLPSRPPTVVFAGRHTVEKRLPDLVAAVASARRRVPDLQLDVYGDGPARTAVAAAARMHGIEDAVSLPGWVADDVLMAAIRAAACVATASAREGYGMLIVEAAAQGCPVVVVAGPDNAAVEHVDDGVNGLIASDTSPAALSDAIVRVVTAGTPLRRSTAVWYAQHARALALETSLDEVLRVYGSSVDGGAIPG